MTKFDSPEWTRSERWFAAWARGVLRFRWVLLLSVTLATTFWLVVTARMLRVDTTTEGFMASDSEPAMVLEELRDQFGGMLQIGVHGDDEFAVRMFQPRLQGCFLAEVAREGKDAHP